MLDMRHREPGSRQVLQGVRQQAGADLRGLWHEYLEWGNDELQRHYGLRMGAADAMVADGLSHLDEFAPPRGCLLLAHTQQVKLSLNKKARGRKTLASLLIQIKN